MPWPGTRIRRDAAPQVRELPADGRVQDSRRLQHDGAALAGGARSAASSPIRPATTVRRSRSRRAQLGAPAVIVMPTTAPKVKVDGARGYGAEVTFAGTTSLDRKVAPRRSLPSAGSTIVPPFDHPMIIAGQGTVGLEILDQCPDVGDRARRGRRRRPELRRLGRHQAARPARARRRRRARGRGEDEAVARGRAAR